MRVRAGLLSMLVALTGALALGALAAGPAAAAEGECSNEAIRKQQGATYLPECRAYEMVSPPGEVLDTGRAMPASAATAGPYAGAIGWTSLYAAPGTHSTSEQFLSTRGASGWTTVAAAPNQGPGENQEFACHAYAFFSETLEAGVVSANRESDGARKGEEETCPRSHLVEGEPEGVQNLFLRNNVTGQYSLVNGVPIEGPPTIATFQAGSADMGSVLFSEQAKLTPEAPVGEDLYEQTDGSVRLVTLLPNGTPATGRLVDAARHTIEAPGEKHSTGGVAEGAAMFAHATSSDGSRAIFEAEEGRLYLRVNATQPQSAIDAAHEAAVNGEQCEEAAMACTIEVDGSGEGTFLWANEADTKIFFMDAAALTADAEAGSGQNLYEYRLPAGAKTGTLTDLTPGESAEVLGISGLGEDEGRAFVYFVSKASLSGANAEGTAPQEGQPNLYLREEGASTTFIATLSATRYIDSKDWAGTAEEVGALQARVSPNGRFIAFNSAATPKYTDGAGHQTEYDNADVHTGEPDSEIYLYDASAAQLHCASCYPEGSRPSGATRLPEPAFSSYGSHTEHLQRNVLDDGAVFFDTPDALLPNIDTNGQSDVYEYRNGALSLISSGTSPYRARFQEATPDGRNVYFVTTQGLVGSDADNALSLYDARVSGGFPEPPAASEPCTDAQECQGAGSSAPPLAAPPSLAFTGLGNLKPPTKSSSTHARKGKAKKSGKARAKRRRRKLRHALKRCRRHFRHNRHRRRACKRRARKRYGAKAKGARHHGRGRRHPGHHHHHHRRHHGGAR